MIGHVSRDVKQMPPEDKGSSTQNGGRGNASSTRSYVKLLLQRFPHVQSASLQLLERHETFRELCEEYEVCSEATERLEREQRDPPLREEYGALRLRLEGELLRYIEEHGGSRGPR
jgi:hypothetical protein